MYSDESLSSESIVQEGLVPFVVDAVETFARAIQRLNVTKSQLGILKGGELLTMIRNVSFTDGLTGNKIQFNENGDGMRGYTIYQYQKKKDKYDYVTIGKWDEILTINSSLTRWRNGSTELPVSICHEPCRDGEIRRKRPGDCCWDCQACKDFEIIALDNQTGQRHEQIRL
ncbi:DgyrCDS10731 [Dimorphilus gyrociliatus]|uniref:DgyrCDS10731 n=1 Tax=Dimorphilus gyrociliatus TaxID=2664684 RepID=A0A7I8W2A6_9ANNE|nr:DgyrCDS10731 [Dimorphilus gyrociliatus]